MSKILRPRNILIAGAAVGLYAFLPSKHKPAPVTTGSQNIADAYSRGGGGESHQPGAATKLGEASETASNQSSPRGKGTPHFEENQAAQKSGKAWPAEKA